MIYEYMSDGIIDVRNYRYSKKNQLFSMERKFLLGASLLKEHLFVSNLDCSARFTTAWPF